MKAYHWNLDQIVNILYTRDFLNNYCKQLTLKDRLRNEQEAWKAAIRMEETKFP
jgi:hypothetical protein